MSTRCAPPCPPTLLECALLILDDACPPDRGMYLCCHGEDGEVDCAQCWRHYLWYLEGGRERSPYQDPSPLR